MALGSVPFLKHASQSLSIPNSEGDALVFARVYLAEVSEFLKAMGTPLHPGRVVKQNNSTFRLLMTGVREPEDPNFYVALVEDKGDMGEKVDQAIELIKQNPLLDALQEDFFVAPEMTLKSMQEAESYKNKIDPQAMIYDLAASMEGEEAMPELNVQIYLEQVSTLTQRSLEELQTMLERAKAILPTIKNLTENTVQCLTSTRQISEEDHNRLVQQGLAAGLTQQEVETVIQYTIRAD